MFHLRAKALIILLGVMVVGCGPKVTVAPEFESAKPKLVAFLGTIAPEDIRKERVAYLANAVRSAVQGRDYLLLDESVVRKICPTAECPDRKQLADRYGVQAFLTLRVESVSRNNFGVGYWNSVKGVLSLTQPTGAELLAIDHSEREQGGVVFQSGQVLQGIIEQVNNSGDDSFNKLADKFARTLALKLPKAPASAAPTATTAVRNETDLEMVDIRQLRSEVYEVCARSNSGSAVSILMNRQRTNLRPAGPSRFCGIYRLHAKSGTPGSITVEARSAFGAVQRREIALDLPTLCNLDGRVALKRQGDKRMLLLSCVAIGKQSVPCSAGQVTCPVEKLLVYKAPAESGPYEKVVELRTPNWTDARGKDAFYRVVAINSGASSLPITPTNAE